MTILYELKIRKIGLIELILMGFDVYMKNIKSILMLFFRIVLPFIIILIFFISLINIFVNFEEIGLTLGLVIISFQIIVPLIFLIIIYTIYNIAISVITDNYVHGINISYQNVVKKIFSSLNSILWLGLKYRVNVLLGNLILVIPGIIYSINNLYYGSAIILRDQRGEAAFAYSRSIVKGNCGRVFVYKYLFTYISLIFYILISGILQQIFSILSIFLKTLPFMSISGASFVAVILTLVSGILSLFLLFFFQTVLIIGNILLFFNLEFHKNLQS